MLRITVYWEKPYTVCYAQYVITTNNYIYLSVHLSIHVLSIYLSMSQTNSRLRRPTPETKISSGNQYNPSSLMEFQRSSLLSTDPTSCTYPEPA